MTLDDHLARIDDHFANDPNRQSIRWYITDAWADAKTEAHEQLMAALDERQAERAARAAGGEG
jgi:DNA-binding GntR family transcriptional regulator